MGYREIAVEAVEALENVRDVFGAMADGYRLDARGTNELATTLLKKPSALRYRLRMEDAVTGFRGEIDDL